MEIAVARYIPKKLGLRTNRQEQYHSNIGIFLMEGLYDINTLARQSLNSFADELFSM